MLTSMLVAFIISLFSSLLLIRYVHMHQHITADQTQGPQNLFGHSPRVGGITLICGCIGGALIASARGFTGITSVAMAGSLGPDLFGRFSGGYYQKD